MIFACEHATSIGDALMYGFMMAAIVAIFWIVVR